MAYGRRHSLIMVIMLVFVARCLVSDILVTPTYQIWCLVHCDSVAYEFYQHYRFGWEIPLDCVQPVCLSAIQSIYPWSLKFMQSISTLAVVSPLQRMICSCLIINLLNHPSSSLITSHKFSWTHNLLSSFLSRDINNSFGSCFYPWTTLQLIWLPRLYHGTPNCLVTLAIFHRINSGCHYNYSVHCLRFMILDW